MRRIYLYYSAVGVIFIAALIFLIVKEQSRVPYALEVDATKDTTDIAGTYYRVRINNIGLNQLSNISVFLGKNDVQYLDILVPGQSFFLSKTRNKSRKDCHNYKRRNQHNYGLSYSTKRNRFTR